MARVRCLHCGAEIISGVDKCPYCDTSYYDFTHIDFNSDKPIVLRFKNGNYTVEQLVVPHLDTIESSSDTTDVTDCSGNIIKKIYVRKYMTTNINFEAIPMSDGSLIKVVV